MGSRRKSREVALQVLYLWEISSGDVERAVKHFWREGELDEKVSQFALELIHGTIANSEKLDKLLESSSENWRLDRMAIIDRNVMRMAVYEFLFMSDTPAKVVINEAIEIVKRFSTSESTQFVNGLLDNIRKKIESGEISGL